MTSPVETIVHRIDDFDLPEFLPVAAAFGSGRYGFVVTPNVDHLIRYNDDATFREYYGAAAYVLMDSRFAAWIVRLSKGVRLPVCTGSDLTAALFANVIAPDDRVVVVGGSAEQAETLAKKYGLRGLRHHDPPMGFVRDPAAVEACLEFVERWSPFRFCFLAVGSPQQEMLAHELGRRGVGRGLALCVGASIDFLTGEETRAPAWMQRANVEWLYRLTQDPQKLAKRYFVRGPRFFSQLSHWNFVVRKAAPG